MLKLIELFSGIGAQAKALENLGIEFESHRTCEWEVNAIKSYKEIHFPDVGLVDTLEQNKEFLIDTLFEMGISSDGKKPMTREQIARKGEPWLREVYKDILITHNMVDITKVHAEDLGIDYKDTYLLTYSFPCQDLSIAGTQKGMEKGSGTRSGLLWEVERILQECDIKPKFLLMENVIQVHGKKHMDDFESWLKSLEDMGYSNYYQDLNAKNYGVPQNRNRCFMLSVLDDTTPFAFPEERKLTVRLKDMLEVDVEENFYLKGDPLKNLVLNRKENKSGIIEEGNLNRSGQKDTVISPEGICTSLMATDYKQPKQITVGLKDLLEDSVDEKFYLDEEQVSKLKIKNKDALIYDKSMLGYEENSREYNDIMPAITSREYKEPRCVNETVLKDIGVKQVGNIVHTGNWDNPQRGRIYSPDGLSPSLNTVGGGGLEPKIIESDMIHVGDIPKEVLNDNERQRRVYSDKGVSPSLLGRNDSPKLLQNLRIRKLTPKECWRLMGFSDDDFKKAEKVNSNSQLYKQAGNSIVVNVLEAIFSKMKETYPDCFEEKFMWDEEL